MFLMKWAQVFYEPLAAAQSGARFEWTTMILLAFLEEAL